MRRLAACISAIACIAHARPAPADVQSFHLHFADPPVAIPGGTTSYVIDTSGAVRDIPLVFEQVTPDGETASYPTFTTPPFASETTLLPIASVRLFLGANQKMRSCASPAAALSTVGPGGALTPIGGTTRTGATVVQSSAGGTVDTEMVRVEFPVTDTTIGAGEGLALATSLTNDCRLNRRTFFAYDGPRARSGIRFQCCFTSAAKCASKKILDVRRATSLVIREVAKGPAKGAPHDAAKVELAFTYLARLFAKRELPGACPTTGDFPVLRALVEAFVADLDATLDPLGPNRRSKCQAKKLAAVAQHVSCALGLEAKAVAFGQLLDPDPIKRAACVAKLAAAFTRAEAQRDPCDTTGDVAAVRADAEAFIATVTSQLACPCP